MDKIELEFIEKQKQLCLKYNTTYCESSFDKLVGVALSSFNNAKMPINGLRHPIESSHSANWYIWAGDYSDEENFFQPLHIQHLLELCPKAINYLGLPPGWRFLFDNKFEDVWFDADLLDI